MTIEIIPTRAALGAEISGIDLAQPLDDETFAMIERAYNEHGVIFFRDQHITPAQQVAFTRRFGEIEFNIFGERWSVPGTPEIVVVSNVTEDGRPIGIRRAGENWHSDMCYAARPPRGTISTRSKFRCYTVYRWAIPNLPVPQRHGTHCQRR
jgi:taurine dioxygenase